MVQARCREKGHGAARVAILETQMQAYQAIFADLATAMIAQVNEGQRAINREFTPVIEDAMAPAYERCAKENGTGSYKRMKSAMSEHVSYTRVQMFEDATEKVRGSITELCDVVRKAMLERADAIYLNMSKDYMSVLGGTPNVRSVIPKAERDARRFVDEKLDVADQLFQEVMDAGLDDLKKDNLKATEPDEDVVLDNNAETPKSDTESETETEEEDDGIEDDEEEL